MTEIKDLKQRVISISEIKDSDLIGVIYGDTEEKAIVLSNGNEFYGLDKDDVMFSYGEDKWTSATKKQYVEEVLSDGGKAYLFETFGELCKWMEE